MDYLAKRLEAGPPRDVDSEQIVLGSCIVNPDALDDLDGTLEPDDFFEPRHAALYRELRQMHEAGTWIEAESLIAHLRKGGALESVGGVTYIADVLSAAPSSAHVEYYGKLVAECATLRNLLEAVETTREEAVMRYEPIEAILSHAESRLFTALDRRATESVHPIGDVLHQVLERLDARQEGKIARGLETGYPDLDAATGGLRNGELIIVAGRTGSGKTSLATNITERAALAGVKVAIASLEMSKLELTDRMLMSLAHVSIHKANNGYLTAANRADIVTAAAKVSKMHVFIDDNSHRTVGQIAAMARRLKRKDGLQLLVVDYLQLITPDNPRDPRQEQVSAICRRLKILARELDIPIVCLAQLNRQADGPERPKLSHLRESGAIEQDSDIVLFCYRPELHLTNEDDKAKAAGKFECIIAKHRNGPTGVVHMFWDAPYMRLESCAQPRQEAF